MSEMNDKKPFEILGDVSFPSPIASFEEKKEEGWGLNVARAIQSEYFYNYFGGMCKYYTQRESFIERRMYARGLQSMTKYFDSLGTEGDLKWLNLSKKPITIIPKLVDIVVNGMSNRGYVIKATAIDQLSEDDRVSYRRQLEDDRLGKDIAVQAKEMLGVEVSNMPIDEIPETKEEEQLHLELKYKPSYELSQELAIESVMKDNDYDDITNTQVIRDLVECGLGCVKQRFVPNRGILVEYVNIENKLQSYTEDPYYRDCFWHAEHKRVLISDVLVDYPEATSDPMVKTRLASSGNSWDAYYNTPEPERLKGTTNLLFFTYKTTRENVKKIVNTDSNGKEVFNFTAIKNEKKDYRPFKKASKVEEVLFEGIFVLCTDIILKWEVSENMARPKSNKQKVCEQYIMVAPNKEKGYLNSLVARMMTIDDLIQICELKAQQMIQRMMPDGYFIDEDALAEVDLGEGNVLKPQSLLDMFFQTGSIIGRSYTSGGEYNYAKMPVTELNSAGNLSKLQALRVERDSYRNDQREVIGLNKASDASTPDKDSLVGLQKLASLNSNTATRHILDSSTQITKKTAEAVTYRIADILKYFPELKKDLIRKIGATSVEDLSGMEELHLRDFAIYLDLDLDEEERAKLEADMSMAIQQGFLALADKYRILNIKNFKQAVGYMSILMEKFAKKQQKMKQEDATQMAEANASSAERAEQARQQTEQMIGQIKGQLQEMINKGLIDKEIVQGEQNRETLLIKIQGDKEVAQIQGGVQMQKQEESEEAKNERLKKQATLQAELIDQRANNKAPKDFEQDDIDESIFQLQD
jgi:hypothetical protein